jgi:hypothetical protein
VDTYDVTPEFCLAVSRDATGIRWAKLSGATAVTLADLSLNTVNNYTVTISDLDYSARRLTTSAPLPDNPGVVVGNNGRRIYLKLRGSGTSFTWDDDLLVQEGQVTSIHATGADTVTITANQSVLFGGVGNRKAESMTVTTEDGQWHFRGGQVIRKPAGTTLTSGVFTDANGDGFVNMKTYEIGIGDHIDLPADITLRRTSSGWLAKANVPVSGVLQSSSFNLTAQESWQEIARSLKAPQNLRSK